MNVKIKKKDLRKLKFVHCEVDPKTWRKLHIIKLQNGLSHLRFALDLVVNNYFENNKGKKL